jgi:hypothetical protein
LDNKIDTSGFTDRQKANALIAIYTSAGLQVVFDLIEEVVIDSENALIGEDPENEKGVIKLQYAAHYQRALFQRLTQKIDFMVTEGKIPLAAPTNIRSLEDRASRNASFNLVEDEVEQ